MRGAKISFALAEIIEISLCFAKGEGNGEGVLSPAD